MRNVQCSSLASFFYGVAKAIEEKEELMGKWDNCGETY